MSRPQVNGDDYEAPGGSPKRGGNGNGGGAPNFRLSELERRVGILERKIGELNDLCIKIDTKLENVATTTSLWKVFAGTLGISVATFIGHILLRYIRN